MNFSNTAAALPLSISCAASAMPSATVSALPPDVEGCARVQQNGVTLGALLACQNGAGDGGIFCRGTAHKVGLFAAGQTELLRRDGVALVPAILDLTHSGGSTEGDLCPAYSLP